jgi:hypothetical protein
MKHKKILTQFSICLLLMIAAIGGYSLGKSTPQIEKTSQEDFPALITLTLPP